MSGRRKNPDDAVSDALDHFQNRYYELMKAASAVLAAYDDVYGRVEGKAWIGPERAPVAPRVVDAAIEELRKVRGPWKDLLATTQQDLVDNPRGHPCRDCGRLYADHAGLDTVICVGWR